MIPIQLCVESNSRVVGTWNDPYERRGRCRTHALSYLIVTHTWLYGCRGNMDMNRHHPPTDRGSVTLPMKNQFTKQQLKLLKK